MAISAPLIRRCARPFPTCSVPHLRPARRAFIAPVFYKQHSRPTPLSKLPDRTIWATNRSSRRTLTGQETPSAQAYIDSGILSGSKNLVDVKKVLVIGSGGLSIGQAGEFDYSGWFSWMWVSTDFRRSGDITVADVVPLLY